MLNHGQQPFSVLEAQRGMHMHGILLRQTQLSLEAVLQHTTVMLNQM